MSGAMLADTHRAIIEAAELRGYRRAQAEGPEPVLSKSVMKRLAIELAAVEPAYNRSLIAEMLDAYEAHKSCDTDLKHLERSIREQAKLLRNADDAARVGTVKRMRLPSLKPSATGRCMR